VKLAAVSDFMKDFIYTLQFRPERFAHLKPIFEDYEGLIAEYEEKRAEAHRI